MDVLSVFLGLLLFILQELKVVQDKDGDVLYGAALSIRLTRLASILTTVLEPLKKVVATIGAIVPPVLDVLFVLFSAMYVYTIGSISYMYHWNPKGVHLTKTIHVSTD